MSRSALTDPKFRIVGYIDTGQDGRAKGLNARYEIVGYYDPVRDQTRDARLRVVARGNILAALIIGTPALKGM